jgi:hypothetical protein
MCHIFLGDPSLVQNVNITEKELDVRVYHVDTYDNHTYIIDIASLPASLFSTPVKLSTSPIEFPFTTSISNFAFKC